MRILYISNEYPPETGFGGIGTYTRCMAQAMAGRGHDVHVICRAADGTACRRHDGGVTLHRTPPGTFRLPPGRPWFAVRLLMRHLIPATLVKRAWSDEAAAAACRLVREDGPFDIVEYPECNGEGFSLPRSTARTVVRLHTPWSMIRSLDTIREGRVDRFFADRMEYRSVRRADAVTSPSHDLASRMKRQWGLRDVTVFPNPIPAGDYARTAGTGWIYTGRVERRKGVHVLLHAYGRLSRTMELPGLTLVGRAYGVSADGTTYESHITGLIREYGLDGRVQWVKGVPHDQVASHLAAASVAIFPSLWENFPYACLEAMASGLAVVTSRCGGFPDMIDEGVTGFMFEPGDVDGLSAVLRRLAGGPDTVRETGLHAREEVLRRFSSRTVGQTAESFYRSLVGGSNGTE